MLTARVEEWKRPRRREEWLEGWREGYREGQMNIVLGLLEYRFGAMPGWASERLAVAESEDLEAWSLRLLDASSLDEVFR